MSRKLSFKCKAHIIDRLHIDPRLLDEVQTRKKELFYVELQERNGKVRDIHKCKGALRKFLPKLNRVIASLDVLPPELYGGVKNKSIFKSAANHAKKKHILKLDLKDFYHSIKPKMIQSVFERLDCSEPMAKLLTYICTANNHIPQGFSTSPLLAAHAIAPFACELRALLAPHHLTFTVWVDDITISGYTSPGMLIPQIQSLCKRHGIRLNKDKIKPLRKGKNVQRVTGVTIADDRLSVGSKFRRDTEKMVHILKKFGWSEVSEKFSFDAANKGRVIQKIKGRINHIKQANVAQASKLEAALHEAL